MGWTSYHADFCKCGTVDRKAECDNYIRQNKLALLKSYMYGSTYYAAVQNKDEGETFAVVILTNVNIRDFFNFSYKSMTEFEGPANDDCPIPILVLLSETDDEYANDWRDRCFAKAKKKAKLQNLEEGAKIRFRSPYDMNSGIKYDDEVILQKKIIGGRTKWVIVPFNYLCWKEKNIPNEFEVMYED